MTKKFIESNMDAAKCEAAETAAKVLYRGVVVEKDEIIDLILTPIMLRIIDDAEEYLEPEDYLEFIKLLNGNDMKFMKTSIGYRNFIKKYPEQAIAETDVEVFYPMVDKLVKELFEE